MIAIEIKLNGDVKAVCGAEYVEEVLAIIRARGKLGINSKSKENAEYIVECMGVTQSTNLKEALKWVDARLSVGDEISIKFIETDHASEPIDRQEISGLSG